MRGIFMGSSLLALALGAFLALGIAACKRSRPAPTDLVAGDGGVIVERAFGNVDDQRRVGFTVSAVFRAQKPTAAAPWHEAGGGWTFFDAATSSGIPFGFGIESTKAAAPIAFSKALLTVPDAAAGAKLVDLFAKTFGGKPAPERARHPLRFEPITAAILGAEMRPLPGGGYGGAGGSYSALKLFLQRDGLEAEVFFNFDLDGKVGEFTEKDRDYADDMVAFLARELRDGPPPERTPENDPQISAVGPQIEGWRSLGEGRPHGLAPGGKRYWMVRSTSPGERVVSVPLDGVGEERELVRVPHTAGTVSCVGDGPDTCLVEDRQASTPGAWSSEDERAYVLFDLKAKTHRDWVGPWGADAVIGEIPWAPDGSWVAMWSWKPRPHGPNANAKYRVLYLVPLEGSPVGPIDLGEMSVGVVGWTGRGPTLRVEVERHDWGKDDAVERVSVDPRTGKVVPLPPRAAKKDGALSPDGRSSFACKDKKTIEITDVASKKTRVFSIHEDDRRSLSDECASWATSRYLAYDTARRGFIDVDTLKLSFLRGSKEELAGLAFTPDFAYAIATPSGGARVGKVVLPKPTEPGR